jgi:outer membrane protein assembly factor BamE
MTRSQVMFLLGTPMVPNGFNTDRWDYYYYVKFNRRIPSQTKRLTVYFKDDKVERVERTDNTVPVAAPAPAPAQPATAAAAPATP